MPARERLAALQGGLLQETRESGKLHLQDRIQAAVYAVRRALVEQSPQR